MSIDVTRGGAVPTLHLRSVVVDRDTERLLIRADVAREHLRRRWHGTARDPFPPSGGPAAPLRYAVFRTRLNPGEADVSFCEDLASALRQCGAAAFEPRYCLGLFDLGDPRDGRPDNECLERVPVAYGASVGATGWPWPLRRRASPLVRAERARARLAPFIQAYESAGGSAPLHTERLGRMDWHARYLVVRHVATVQRGSLEPPHPWCETLERQGVETDLRSAAESGYGLTAVYDLDADVCVPLAVSAEALRGSATVTVRVRRAI